MPESSASTVPVTVGSIERIGSCEHCIITLWYQSETSYTVIFAMMRMKHVDKKYSTIQTNKEQWIKLVGDMLLPLNPQWSTYTIQYNAKFNAVTDVLDSSLVVQHVYQELSLTLISGSCWTLPEYADRIRFDEYQIQIPQHLLLCNMLEQLPQN